MAVELKKIEEMSENEALQELIEHSILLDGNRFDVFDGRISTTTSIDVAAMRQAAGPNYVYNHISLNPKSIIFVLGEYGLVYCTPYSSRRLDIMLNKLNFEFSDNIKSPLDDGVPSDDALNTYWYRLLDANVEYTEAIYRLQAESIGRTRYLDEAEISCCFRIAGTVVTKNGTEYTDRFDSLKAKELGTYCQMGGIMAIRDTNGRLYITTDLDVMASVVEEFEYLPQPVPFYCGGKPINEDLASEFDRIIQRQ